MSDPLAPEPDDVLVPEPDALDIGSRVLWRGEPGTIVGAIDDPYCPWWSVRLDAGALVAPAVGHPDLHIWSPATPSERLRAARRAWTRRVLEDVRAGMITVDTADRLIDIVVAR